MNFNAYCCLTEFLTQFLKLKRFRHICQSFNWLRFFLHFGSIGHTNTKVPFDLDMCPKISLLKGLTVFSRSKTGLITKHDSLGRS